MLRSSFLGFVLLCVPSLAATPNRANYTVSSAQIGAITPKTKYGVKWLLRVFPMAKVRERSCYPSDVLPTPKDALMFSDPELGGAIYVCSDGRGGVRLVTTTSAVYIGYANLQVGARWRSGIFKADECRPEVQFFTSGTYDQVTCRPATESNVGYTFTTPPFNYGDGKPPRIDFAQGHLTAIEWAPRTR